MFIVKIVSSNSKTRTLTMADNDSNGSIVSKCISREECDAYVGKLMLESNQQKHYNVVEKILKNIDSSQMTQGKVATMLSSDEGPIFLLASQANALRYIIDPKIKEDEFSTSYDYDHVLCSRVLDYWNLKETYTLFGSGCYYMASSRPKELFIDKILENQTKDFLHRAFHDIESDIYSFIFRCADFKPKHKKKRSYKMMVTPVVREKRIRRKPTRYITEM